LPRGLAEISLCERALWNTRGPLLESGDITIDAGVFAGHPPLYHVWPTLAAWAQFYAAVRDELLTKRPSLAGESAAERIFLARREGRIVAHVQHFPDPRLVLVEAR
jgi:hypothetical protein